MKTLLPSLTATIIPPVFFFCSVSGEPLKAYFTGMIDHPLFYCFRIKFSNGFEDVFTLMENGLVEGDKKSDAAAYSTAIKNDLHALVYFSAGKEIYTLRWPINNEPCNVWVIESVSTPEKIYKVCCHSYEQFQIKKAGAGWVATKTRESDKSFVDIKLATEIGRLIDRDRGHS